MSADGGREEITGTRAARLPAWSPDGKRLAWTEQTGRRTFALYTAEIQ